MTTTIDAYTTRPKRTFQEDGLLDMACGTALLALGVSIYVGIVAQAMIAASVAAGVYPPTAWQQANHLTDPISWITFLSVPLSFHGVMFLKRRFVYPRLGYFEPRAHPNPWLNKILLIACLLFSTILISFAFRYGKSPAFWTSDTTLVSLGIGTAIVLVVNYLKLGFVRHLLVAGIALLSSISLAATTLDWQHAEVFFVVVLGLSLIVSGAVPFMRVLRLPVLSEDDAS